MGIQLNQKDKELQVIDLRIFLLVNLNYKNSCIIFLDFFYGTE